MAAVSPSPPPMSTPSGGRGRDRGSRHAETSSAAAAGSVPRQPHASPLPTQQKSSLPPAASNGSSQGLQHAFAARPAIELSHSASDAIFSPTSAPRADRHDATAMSPKDRLKSQLAVRKRTSRGSDDITSTFQQQQQQQQQRQQPGSSVHSSAATSASSSSAANDGAEYPRNNGETPESSILEDNLSQNHCIPQFQYHHQEDRPPRVRSVTGDTAPSSSTSEHGESAGNIRRHLTPTSSYANRTSLPRPLSSYSSYSDYGPRGRSPNLLPGSAHYRAPSAQSRKSPDVRLSSYAELLNAPYPQDSTAPLSLDNSSLRNAVGSNASLLSTQTTLDMYRQNMKKTSDSSIQYSFAVFLVSTAREHGLEAPEPKARKAGAQSPGGAESPVDDGSISSPHELVREARQILQRLANGGYPFAQYYLADGYASGLFSKGKEDYNSAFPLFVLAAKHGHAESAYRAALCYEFGWGCRKDAAKSVQFLRPAASKRHPGAMTRLGKACLSGDLGETSFREGIKWMKLATEAADSQYNAAPYQLGCLYETGYRDVVLQDLSYAAELFTQAAGLGHAEANFRMGEAYEHGRIGCPKDPALSVHFYTGAAERGHAAAMMGLCAWYMIGAPPFLDKDEEEAYEWARRSAELGLVKAQYVVGYFTEMGIGCRRDMLEANVWYVKAADAGDDRAKQRLAVIQKATSGEGTRTDGSARQTAKSTQAAKDDKDCVVM